MSPHYEPLLPAETPTRIEALFTVNPTVLKDLGKRDATREALSILNEEFTDTFDKTFVDTLITHGGQRIQVYYILCGLYTSNHTCSISFECDLIVLLVVFLLQFTVLYLNVGYTYWLYG